MKYTLLVLSVFVLFITGCKKEEPQEAVPGFRVATVKEIVNVPQYTYLRVEENGTELWMAVPRMDVAEGTVIYFSKSTEMKNFQSPGMKRTFESILFVEDATTQKPGQAAQKQEEKPMKPVLEKANVSVEKAKDGITIGELFSAPKKYEGKTVILNGQVMKANSAIMGKTWLHIQDGTSSGEDFDLTVTTTSEASVGDVLRVKGKIALNKDFGYGYAYKVLLEDAEISKAK